MRLAGEAVGKTMSNETNDPKKTPVPKSKKTDTGETSVLDPKKLHQQPLRTMRITERPEFETAGAWGNSMLRGRAQLVIKVEGFEDQPLSLHIEDQLVFGRCHVDEPENPDVDLTLYHAELKGVSRKHAALLREGNTIKAVDLNSTNGTYLNGFRVYPGQTRIVRAGDKLALGQLTLKVISLA